MNKRGKRRVRGEGSQSISRPLSKRLSQLLLIPTLLISIFSLLLGSAGEGKPVKPLGEPIEVEPEIGEEDIDEGEAIIHIAKEGETLESIAENYKIAPEILVQTNGIKLTEELRGGQKLVIAQPQQLGEYDGTDEGEVTYYIVAEGDSLWTIAKEYGTTVEELAKANKLNLSDTLRIGQKLLIVQPETPSLTEMDVPGEKTLPVENIAFYTVAKNDSLWTIARRYNTSVEFLADANSISTSSTLSIGQKLIVGFKDGRKLNSETVKELAQIRATLEEGAGDITKPKIQKVIHEVHSGESLWTIARKYDISISSLCAANDLSTRGILSIGQKLIIDPFLTAGQKSSQRTGIVVHKVRPGESVWLIAREYSLDEDTILAANNLRNPNSLRVGQELNIPPAKGVMHKVQQGQNLSLIAQSYGIKISEIIEANNLSNPSRLSLGQMLLIPGVKLKTSSGKEEVVSPSRSSERSSDTKFGWPIKGRLTSGFGWRGKYFHTGIDLAAPTGTLVQASREGKVIYSGWMRYYGYIVIIDHGDGYTTRYAHNSQLLVRKGNYVKKGQAISKVGSTGWATGPHVHFEIRKDGKALNPLSFLR